MTSIHPRSLTAAALAALLVAAPTAVTPAVAQTTQQPAPQAAPGEFSEDQLRSFAKASLEVENLHQQWQPKIAGTTEPQEQANARDQAMREMTQAVREAGLSVDEYNQIASAMQIDPETARTVQEYRADMQ